MKSSVAISMLLLLTVNQFSATPCSAASTALTIGPDTIVLPLIDLGDGNMCFEVALQISNAPKLKEFHINFSYDPSVVDLIEGELDQKIPLIE